MFVAGIYPCSFQGPWRVARVTTSHIRVQLDLAHTVKGSRGQAHSATPSRVLVIVTPARSPGLA
jgi:hypothetical protein